MTNPFVSILVGVALTLAAPPVRAQSTQSCSAAPLLGCIEAGKNRLRITSRQAGARLRWAWRKGDVSAEELGGNEEKAVFCLYEGSGATPLVYGADLPAGPGWIADERKARFRGEDSAGDPQRLAARAGGGSKGSIKLAGWFAPPLSLPLAVGGPVIVQLSRGAACWQSSFEPPVRHNDPKRFVATALRPYIQIKKLPPLGSERDLEGKVRNLGAIGVAVTGYVFVGGRWWGPKPTFAEPTVPVTGGKFVLDFTTGGNDTEATRIAVFAVPAGSTPPFVNGGGLPSIPAAVATTVLHREGS